jgi:branched-chain amino acid transport system permease protein
MSLIFIIQIIMNGLIKGFIYALIAAGFSFIYGQGNILFLGIGQIYMLGAVACYVLMVLAGLPYLVSVLIVFLLIGLLGVALDRGLYRHLEKMKGANQLTFALSSLMLGMFVMGLTQEFFGDRNKGIPNPFSGTLEVFGVIVPWDKLVVVSISVGLLIGLQLFFRHSRWGRAIRAMAQDKDAAQLSGINIDLTKSLTFFLALGLSGATGALIAPLFYVGVGMGDPVLMSTLIVVVLGGLGSFAGAIAGGLSFGLIESFGHTYLGGITTILSFAMVMIVLIVRPQGLVGHD